MHGSNLNVPSLHLHTYGYVGCVVNVHSPSPQAPGKHWLEIMPLKFNFIINYKKNNKPFLDYLTLLVSQLTPVNPLAHRHK